MAKKKKKEPEYEGEKCQRCGKIGEDRRTLKMACFYEMFELKIPFLAEVYLKPKDLHDVDEHTAPSVLELKDGTKITVGAGSVTCSGELRPEQFYTLRVCKACRAQWMDAIKNWFTFTTTEYKPYESPGSGIWIRENGACIEISQEEWDKRYAERIPVKVLP